jgi:hypothetical protein
MKNASNVNFQKLLLRKKLRILDLA